MLNLCLMAALLALHTVAVTAETFSFIGVGDIPYDDAQIAAFEQSISAINQSDAEFVFHMGDIKGSSTPCDETVFAHRAAMYNRFVLPFTIIVGDNEFNDCDHPESAIALFREHFCAKDASLGQRTMPLDRQSTVQPEFHYPEHIRWEHSGVHFLGLNVVGSSNHIGNHEEWDARTKAGVAWLKAGFNKARAERAPAMVVAIHANPFGEGAYPEPFAPIMTVLEEEAEAYGKPVLFMHGDSHYFRWDIPFRSKSQPGAATNLSRLEVFGSPNPHWVEIMVDTECPQVFSIKPHFLKEE